MAEETNYPSNQPSPNDRSSSQNQPPSSDSQQSNLEQLIDRTLEQKQTVQTVNQLQTRMKWLTGLFVVALIVLGGGLGWASYRLQQQQKQISQQNAPIEPLKAQIEELREQVPNPETIENLKKQLDELNTSVEENQQVVTPETIERLENQIDELSTTVEDNQKTLERVSNKIETRQQRNQSNGSDF